MTFSYINIYTLFKSLVCLLIARPLRLSQPVLNISKCDLARLLHDIIFMLCQMLQHLLIIDHFSNCYQCFMSHNRGLVVVEHAVKEERHRMLVQVFHLCKYISNLVLEQSSTCCHVVFRQSLADGYQRFLRVYLSQSEESAISLEQIVLVFLVYEDAFQLLEGVRSGPLLRLSWLLSLIRFLQVPVARSRIGWRWVVSFELQLVEVKAFRLTTICCNAPINKFSGQEACFVKHD